MIVRSKKHSSELIKRLGLNGVPEEVFTRYNRETIEYFCDSNPASKYILRDLDNPSGKYFICNSKDECINNAKEYNGAFSLAVSCFAYDDRILLGEVLISNNRIVIGARNDQGAHHRNIYDNPCINLDTDWDNKKLWTVNGVEEVFNYLTSKNIYDVIVEFVVFNHPVGLHNNRVLIVELRSNY